MTITLNDILNKTAHVHIEYIDVDKKTVLNTKKFSGKVTQVDIETGISIIPEEDKTAVAVIPPAVEAWSINENGDYNVSWLVFRTQTNRTDGQHEWWDWQPKCIL